jgi:hypothetical protein
VTAPRTADSQGRGEVRFAPALGANGAGFAGLAATGTF